MYLYFPFLLEMSLAKAPPFYIFPLGCIHSFCPDDLLLLLTTLDYPFLARNINIEDLVCIWPIFFKYGNYNSNFLLRSASRFGTVWKKMLNKTFFHNANLSAMTTSTSLYQLSYGYSKMTT